MKINVLEIPEEGLDIDEKEDLEDDTSGLVREIRYRLKIEKFKEDVFIRGGVDAGLGLQCSRCLKDFEDGVSVELDLSFGPARALKGDEKHELRPEEMEAGFYTEDELDLTEITREQVILSIPMKPLCSDSCKGHMQMHKKKY
jgi:uncharacterized protein